MKKLSFILIALAFMACKTSFGQSKAMTVTSASYANTGADTATLISTPAASVVSIQPVITKISGTVAGTAVLYGSLIDGNYVSTGDTLTLTNQTVNSKVWFVTPSKYLYYRVRVVGSGTMGASFKCWLLTK